ncbi:MAG: BON domain-containing protein [Pseudomonadota bacterium]|nr:BON domain-containing protein [Pseudomonadota bacterium]
MTKIKLFFTAVIYLVISLLNTSCTQVVIGGAASGGMILVQERTAEQAAKDILIKTRLEESFFSTNYDEIFSKIKIIVFEGKVLLVGTVKNSDAKETADSLAWKINNVKEVANYIVVGKTNVIDYLKDARISLEFKAKLLTDKDISEVNYSSTTENRVLYIIGVSQNENELKKVLNHASNVAGVKKIINLVIDKNSPERKKHQND